MIHGWVFQHSQTKSSHVKFLSIYSSCFSSAWEVSEMENHLWNTFPRVWVTVCVNAATAGIQSSSFLILPLLEMNVKVQ